MPRKKKEEIEILSPDLARESLLSKYPGLCDKKPVPEPISLELCLRSPSTQLNILTGEGGFRPGAIVEQYGPESSLKTWLALELCREAQSQFPTQSVAYFDLEQRVDQHTAAVKIGVSLEPFDNGFPRFNYFPETWEEIPTLESLLNRIDDYVLSGLFSLIVVDSVAAMMPLVEIESDDITHVQVAGAPLLLSKGFRKIGPHCARTGTRLWLVNQMRTSFTMTPRGSIAKKEPGGGMALKYAATHRIKTEYMDKERGSDQTGLHILTEKVKYGPNLREAVIPFTLGVGVDKELDLVRAAESYGVVTKRGGGYYEYEGHNIVQGEKAFATMLREDADFKNVLEEKTLHTALSLI